jgi:hypothetical protein
MKNKRIIFTVLAFLLCIGMGFAQTKAKKPAPKKKPAPAAISVYVCDSQKDKLFHKRRTCAGLNKCSGEIKFINSAATLKKYKRKSCPRCHSK